MTKLTAIRSATQFYGSKTCVLTARTENSHWHHLDQNHENWLPSNIIPVSPNANHAIEQIRKDPSNPVSEEIQLDNLKLRGNQHWHYGRFAAAYACSRLGSFLAIDHYKDPDLALQFAIWALQSLRPLANDLHAEDTLRRSVLPIILRQCLFCRLRLETMVNLCKEIGAYYLDYGQVDALFTWIALADAIHRAKRCEITASFILALARLHQHLAFGHLTVDQLRIGRSLLVTQNATMQDLNYTFGITTNSQHLALAYLRAKRIYRADRELAEVQKTFGMVAMPADLGTPFHLGRYSWWTYGRMMLVQADLALAKQQREVAFAGVHTALRVLAARRIRAVGATDFVALKEFYERYPKDAHGWSSQTGGKPSVIYSQLASRIQTLLWNHFVQFYR